MVGPHQCPIPPHRRVPNLTSRQAQRAERLLTPLTATRHALQGRRSNQATHAAAIPTTEGGQETARRRRGLLLALADPTSGAEHQAQHPERSGAPLDHHVLRYSPSSRR